MMAKTGASPILQLIRRVVEDRLLRELPDRDLLERFHAQHDEAAFHTLLRRHGPMVLDVCRGVLGDGPDAEDAFQATFLVLAHKAGSIRKGASLGSWLHGVAHRTALKARARSIVRQKHEARTPVREVSLADDLSWREVRQVLHEELSGIPECYREALLMCYLEGTTQQRAAARLGLAERTVRERLERGRVLLRGRLARRGLGPAALLLAAAWPAAFASAQPSSTLVAGTVEGATLVAAGQAMPGDVISSNVIALSKEVLQTMVITKLKHLAVLLVCGAAFVGAVALKSGSAADGQGPAPAVNNVVAAGQEFPAVGRAKTKAGDANEQEKLQGTWSFTDLSQGGNKDEEKRAALQIVLKGNTFTLATKDRAALQGTYVVDPSQKPKTMDLTIEKDGEQRTMQAIYEFEGDSLKLCHFLGDLAFKERPKELDANKDTMLGVLKREKK